MFERLTDQQNGALFDRLIGELKQGRPERLLEKAYEQEEKEFIDDLQGKFEIDNSRAKSIAQVMAFKNHGWKGWLIQLKPPALNRC